MKKVARNIIFSVFGFGWTIILALIVTPIIVRRLGESAYGVWALVGNVIGYMVVFNSLQTAAAKYLAEYIAVNDHESNRKLNGTSFIINVAIGFLGCIVIFFFSKVFAITIFKIPVELQPQGIIAFQLASFGFLFGTIGWWGGSILVGLQRFDWLMAIIVSTSTVSAIGSVIAVLQGWGLVGVSGANVFGTFLSVFFYLWSVQKLLPETKRSLALDLAMVKRIGTYGIFSTVHVLFAVLMSQLDRTLLGMWIGVAAVTTYSIPLSVASRIHQLSAKALEVVFPMSSSLDEKKHTGQIQRLFLRAQNLNTVLVLMLTIPLITLAPEILRFWISPNFAIEGSLVFRYLVIAYAILASNVVMAGMVAGFGHPEVNTIFVITLGLGNLVGYILFIPKWGVNGAGVASVFGSIISVPIFLWYVNHRFLRVPPFEILIGSIIRPLIAGILMILSLILFRPFLSSLPMLFLVLSTSSTIFIISTFLLGVWEKDELDILKQVWSKLTQ